MKKMLFLTLSLLCFLIVLFISCVEEENLIDCDPLELPVYKIQGDTISFDEPDCVVFKSKLASKMIFYSIVDVSEPGNSLELHNAETYYQPNLDYPYEILQTPENPNIRIIQENPTTYYVYTNHLYKKALYTFYVHPEEISPEHYRTGCIVYFTFSTKNNSQQ